MFTTSLNAIMARDHARELRGAAARHPRSDYTPVTSITLRYSVAADRAGLNVLAELDSADAPTGPALVAVIDGRLRAALPLDGGTPIADPFHRSAELIDLLRLRAAQLRHA